MFTFPLCMELLPSAVDMKNFLMALLSFTALLYFVKSMVRLLEHPCEGALSHVTVEDL